jgi:sterol desaturase/sphingolipid hydroxylase (fatty acid hydroxylase superfamily)
MEAFLKYAVQAYAFAYFGAVIVLALLEGVAPRRVAGDTLRVRWFGNFAITILGTVLVRALFPMVGVGWAVFCATRGWGLFNQVACPFWLAFIATIVLIDVVNYTQHYLLHRVPVLWRLHRTHHTDQEYDFTTGVRFHPLEDVFATAVLVGATAALGAPPAAVLASQLLSVTVTFVEHANVRVPAWLDRIVRLLVVTPDMHRIHHSQDVGESLSNFSNTFSFWDRLFGTYLEEPAAGQDGIAFGVREFGERKHLTLPWMLAQPFLSQGENAEAVIRRVGSAPTPAERVVPPARWWLKPPPYVDSVLSSSKDGATTGSGEDVRDSQ